MKILIWIFCFLIHGFITTQIYNMGIMLGAIPTVILLAITIWCARRLCKIFVDDLKDNSETNDSLDESIIDQEAKSLSEVECPKAEILPTIDAVPILDLPNQFSDSSPSEENISPSHPVHNTTTLICKKCGKEISFDSAFCNHCGRKVGQKKKISWLLCAVILSIAVFTISLSSYVYYCVTNYAQGLEALNNQNFGAAQRCFDRLPFRDHFVADEYAYAQAGILMEKGNYYDALLAFDKLENITIPAETIDRLVENIALEGNGRKLWEQLNSFKNITFSPFAIDNLKECIYLEAVSLYQNDSTSIADILFNYVGNYKRTSDYKILIEAKINSPSKLYNNLIQLIEFEDTNEILLYPVYDHIFLRGNWIESGTSRYFKFDGSDVSHNLPKLKSSGNGCFFSDGFYYEGKNTSSAVKQFQFTIVDLNTISVLCYKDQTVHILKRQ